MASLRGILAGRGVIVEKRTLLPILYEIRQSRCSIDCSGKMTDGRRSEREADELWIIESF